MKHSVSTIILSVLILTACGEKAPAGLKVADLELGDIEPGEVRVVNVPVTVVGAKDVVIEKISAGCGCLIPPQDVISVGAGKSELLKFTLKTPETYERRLVKVVLQSTEKRKYQFTIGYNVVDSLQFTPRFFSFCEGDRFLKDGVICANKTLYLKLNTAGLKITGAQAFSKFKPLNIRVSEITDSHVKFDVEIINADKIFGELLFPVQFLIETSDGPRDMLMTVGGRLNASDEIAALPAFLAVPKTSKEANKQGGLGLLSAQCQFKGMGTKPNLLIDHNVPTFSDELSFHIADSNIVPKFKNAPPNINFSGSIILADDNKYLVIPVYYYDH